MEQQQPEAKESFQRILINLLLMLVFGFIYFYLELPAINLQNQQFYTFFFILAAAYCIISLITLGLFRTVTSLGSLWSVLKKNYTVPVVICAAMIVIGVVGTVLSSPILRAAAYRSLLTVEEGDFVSEVREISFDQIPLLDEASAVKLGNRKLGELSDMVSQFEVADNYTQINYNGRPVRVTPLVYGDLIKWFNNRSEGLPAYLIIDMITQNVEVVRLEQGMKYSTCEHFSRNLYRHLRFRYPTYMFDDPTFEIDESGTPYWVCPRIVKRIGLFGGTDIEGAVLVNAITGESQYFTELPAWVDRVYTADLIIEQYDYYGTYCNGFWNSLFGQRGVTVTTEGYNYIVIDDDVYMYTGVTSVGGDESNVGFILTNQRTKETKYYPIAGAEEFSAMSSAEGQVQQMKYTATFPLLLNISEQPTYFMALKDSAGLVKMYAMVNVQQYQIVATGSTVAECEDNYIALMAQHGLTTPEISELPPTRQLSGVVAELRSAVLDGSTHYFIRLEDSPFFYRINAADCETAVILNIGDPVLLTVSEETGSIRSAYSVSLAS